MQTDSSARRTGRESASAVEWAITVRIPISRQARMIRSAISPRLAIRILWNISRGVSAGGSTRNSGWPNSTGWPFSTTTLAMRPADLGLDLVHQLHRLDDAEDLALLDHVALGDERRGVGRGAR